METFFEELFKHHGGGTWSMEHLKEYRGPEMKEMGEQEKEIIEKYKQKRNMLKEVNAKNIRVHAAAGIYSVEN